MSQVEGLVATAVTAYGFGMWLVTSAGGFSQLGTAISTTLRDSKTPLAPIPHEDGILTENLINLGMNHGVRKILFSNHF